MKRFKELLYALCFLFVCIPAFAQERQITGRVISESDNAPVAGATITLKGTTRTVAASADGSFTISAPAGPVTLAISSISFATREVNVGADQNNISISLSAGNAQLNEVVVTALGIQRQARTLVYATQTIKPSELTEARDPNNVLNSLQGKVANAVITQGSGGPGSGARIVLRGNRSIQGTNNALIVVDGVPFNNRTNGTAFSDFGSVQGSDGAANLNPDDIESVTVLRGASAAALYGSQAGNGVIVITTKKGKKDRMTVSVNSGVTIETAFALPRVQNIYGQGNGGTMDLTSGESWGAKMEGQSITNYLGQPATYSPQPDNIRDFFRRGTNINNSIGISGGSDKMQTYLSYTNTSVQGIVPRNSMMRHTINLRLTNQVTSRFSTDAKVTYISQDIRNRPRTGEENAPVINIYQIPRNVSLAEAQNYETMDNVGVPAPTPFPSTLRSIYQNPYWVLNRTAINESRDRVIGFLTARYQLADWLSVAGRANLDRTFDRNETQISQGTILWSRAGGNYSKQNLTSTDKWFDVMLEGKNRITNDLRIDYRVGAIYQDNQFEGNFQNANGLNIANKFSLNFAKAPSASSSFTQVQTQSVFGQFNLAFKDAIFLDASLRNDWDSRLPAPHSFQYPSVGVSAVLSDLMTLPEPISFLKSSINYAQVGNGGQFGLLNAVYNYAQGAGNGFLERGSVNPIPNLKPEIVKNLEFGLETRFLRNRIGFTATYYKSNSTNQLLRISMPVATGFSSRYINAGNIQNRGFEFVLNGTAVRNKNFNWDVNLNFALNRNKVVSLSEDLKIIYLGGGFGRSATPVVEEGKSYGDLLAFKWATDEKGGRLVTAEGKPILTQKQEFIGNFNPRYTLGFTNTINYKGISLRLLIDGRVGGTMVSGTEMNLAFSGITEATAQYREGGWSMGGVDANGSAVSAPIRAQDFWQIASGKRYGAGEFFAYDATNIRAREFSLGYDIPVPKQMFVKSMRLSAVGRNLFWIYRGSSLFDIPGIGKRKLWFDPDMSLGNANYQGIEYGTLPSTRSYGVNLQVNF